MANNKDRFSVTYDEAQSKATKNYNGNYNASSNNRLSSSYEEALGKATAKSALKSGIYNENNFNNSLKLYLNGVQKVASKYGQKSYVWNDDDKNEISDLTFQRDSLYDYVSANKDMFDEDTYNELLSSFDSHNYIFDLANNKISGTSTASPTAVAKQEYDQAVSEAESTGGFGGWLKSLWELGTGKTGDIYQNAQNAWTAAENAGKLSNAEDNYILNAKQQMETDDEYYKLVGEYDDNGNQTSKGELDNQLATIESLLAKMNNAENSSDYYVYMNQYLDAVDSYNTTLQRAEEIGQQLADSNYNGELLKKYENLGGLGKTLYWLGSAGGGVLAETAGGISNTVLDMTGRAVSDVNNAFNNVVYYGLSDTQAMNQFEQYINMNLDGKRFLSASDYENLSDANKNTLSISFGINDAAQYNEHVARLDQRDAKNKAYNDNSLFIQDINALKSESVKLGSEMNQNFAESASLISNKFGQMLYELVPSFAGMALDRNFFKATGLNGLYSMGVRVYGSSYGNAISQGYDEQIASEYGLAHAAIEVGTELLGALFGGGRSFDASFYAPQVAKAFENSGVLKRLLAGIGEESIEEFLAEVLDPLAEALLGTDWATDVQTLYAEKLNNPMDFVKAAASGAIMALIGNGGREIVGNAVYDTSTNAQALIDEINKYGGDKAKAYANKMQSVSDAYLAKQATKTKDKDDVGRVKINQANKLKETVQQAYRDYDTKKLTQYASDYLTELGEDKITGKAKVIAEDLVKLSQQGKSLTEALDIMRANGNYSKNMLQVVESFVKEGGMLSTQNTKEEITARANSVSRSNSLGTISTYTERFGNQRLADQLGATVEDVNKARDILESIKNDAGFNPDSYSAETLAKDRIKTDSGISENVNTHIANDVEMLETLSKGTEFSGIIKSKYQDGQMIDDYVAAMNMAIILASNGATQDIVKNYPMSRHLTDAQINVAYEFGKTEYENRRAAEHEQGERLRQQRAESKNNGKIKSGKVSLKGGTIYVNGQAETLKAVDKTKLSQDQLDIVDAITDFAKKTSLNIVFYDGDAKGHQGVYTGSNTIYLNINAGKAVGENFVGYALTHELVHFMEKYAPEEYGQLRDFIMEHCREISGDLFENLVALEMEKDPNLKRSGPQSAESEVIANACLHMLEDTKALDMLYKENKSLYAKIKKLLKQILEKLAKAWTSSIDNYYAVAGFMDKATFSEESAFSKFQGMFDVGLSEAVKNLNTSVNNDAVRTAPNITTEINTQKQQWADNEYYSMSYDQISEIKRETNQKIRELEQKIESIQNNSNLMDAMQKVLDSRHTEELKDLVRKSNLGEASESDLNRIEEIRLERKKADEEYNKAEKESNIVQYNEELRQLRKNAEILYLASENAWRRDGDANDQKLADKAGITLGEYYQKQAIKSFGYTTNFNEAGYLLPNGKLLNFSGDKGQHLGFRTEDHRSIGVIFSGRQSTDALNRFLSFGNIRVIAESPGIDLTNNIAPTNEQYSTIKQFIQQIGAKDSAFYVDFSDADGYRKGSYEYSGNINADKIISDIKYFYDNGTTRYQSITSQFHNQLQKWDENNPALMAIHNKSLTGLERMLKRGGVPFPSIAIKKSGTPHEGFGEVSIVFPRSTVDPELDVYNKIYSNDAWTPTEPMIEYDVESYEVSKQIKEIVGKEIYSALRLGSNLDSDEIAKQLLYSKGDIVKAIGDKAGIKYAYLKSIGKEPTIPTGDETLDGSYTYNNNQIIAVVDALGADTIINASYDDTEILQKIADVLNEQKISQLKDSKFSGMYNKYLENPTYKANNIRLGFLQGAAQKYKNNGLRIESEYDYYGLEKANDIVNLSTSDNDYVKWIHDTFDSVIVDSGIPNNTDVFDRRGNRRTFKQRHVPATMDNIVKEMRKQNETGNGALGINLRGAATKSYDNIESVRADSGRLLGTHVADDVYNSYMEDFRNRLFQMTEDAKLVKSSYDYYNGAEEILLEIIRDSKSKADMFRRIDKEAQWIKVTDSLKEELWQLKQDVQNMPAPYFEAKPRRFVGLDEAIAIIIPDNTNESLIDEMEKQGLEYLVYESGNEQDRLSKLNSLSSAQFQEWNQPENGKAIRKVLGGTMFSGGGTVDFAISAILDSQFAVEYDPKISFTFQQNNKTTFMGKDVFDFDPTEWAGKLGWFHTSPVCKSFSNAINQSAKEKRLASEIDMQAAIKVAHDLDVIKPDVYTLENVPGYKGSKYAKVITDVLRKNGYKWDDYIYNAADYGAATSRDRLIIRAVKNGELPPLPQTVETRTTWYDTVKDIIDTLPEVGVNPRMINSLLEYNNIDVNNISQPLFVFGESYKNKQFGHAFADDVVPTIIANSGASRIFMPDGRVLEATPRVLARITGLSDEYKLPNDKVTARTIIGNGVPVKLTQAVVGSLLNATTGQNVQFQNWEQDALFDTKAESESKSKQMIRLKAQNEEIKRLYTVIQDEYKALNKEVTKLRNSNKKLSAKNEKLVAEFGKTPETVRESDIKKLAKQYSEEYGVNADELTGMLLYLANSFSLNSNVSYDQFRAMAINMASTIVNNANVLVDDSQQELHDYLKDMLKTPVVVGKPNRGDFIEGYDRFKADNKGIIKLRDKGTPIDTFYMQIQDAYGKALFTDYNSGAEMAERLVEAYKNTAPVYGNPYEGYRNEATTDLANRMMADIVSDKVRMMPQTYADKISDKHKAEIEKLQTKIENLSMDRDNRLAEVKSLARARLEERVAKEKADKWERVDAVRKFYQEREKTARARRTGRDYRAKINKLINDLNSMLKRPTETKHVPRELVSQVIDTLSMIDRDTGKNKSLKEEIAKLSLVYDGYKQDPKYAVAYDDVVAESLKQLALSVGTTPLNKMSNQQLELVYNTLMSLTHVVRDSVKVKLRGEEHDAFELSLEMTRETRNAKPARADILQKYIQYMLKPADMFDELAGHKKDSTWMKMAQMFADAETKQERILMLLSEGFAELSNDEKGRAKFMSYKAEDLVDIGLVDEDGNSIPVTHDIMLGIYMDLLNEDNRKHLMYSGKTIPYFKDFYQNKGDRGWGKKSVRALGMAEKYVGIYEEIDRAKIDGDMMKVAELQEKLELAKMDAEVWADELKQRIEDNMTDYDRAFLAATQELMDVKSKKYLNETTMDVYGIEKAIVEHYFPIITDKDFLSAPMESITKDLNLENVGFMKQRVFSKNPTLAMGVVGVVGNQIDKVSTYCSMMPAMRTFNKVYNKTQVGYSDSLKHAINKTFGSSATEYIENYMADLTGSRRVAPGPIDRAFAWMRGNLAPAVLTANPRVALAQTASFPTLAAKLGWRPIVQAFMRGGKDGKMISRADKELIAKYSPKLWYRMQGYSSVEIGDIKKSNQLGAKIWNKLGWFTGWIQAFDGATVGRAWYACEYYVNEHNPDLAKGTDAYYEKVAEVFNDAINTTQPVYGVVQRPAVLRDPAGLVKSLTMFMTQRLQNFNITYSTAKKYQKYRADYAKGLNNVTIEDVQNAKADVLHTATAMIAQGVTLTAFKFLADVLLHNMNKYRDDDDELTVESVCLKLLDMFIDAEIGCILFGAELYTIGKALIEGTKWYGLSVNGVDTLVDTVSDLIDLRKEPSAQAIETFAFDVAQMFGLPADNTKRMAEGIKLHFIDAMNGEFLSFEAGVDREDSQNASLLLKAYEEGNEEDIAKFTAEFESEDKAMNAVKSVLKSRYLNDEVTYDDVVEFFIDHDIAFDEAEADKIIYGWENSQDGASVYDGIENAIIDNDKSTFDSYKMELEQHGYDESDIFNKSKTVIKDQYYTKAVSKQEAIDRLVRFGIMDSDEASEIVQQWTSYVTAGIEYNDIEDLYIAYVNGNKDKGISESRAIDMLKLYGGLTAEKAKEKVNHWTLKAKTGIVVGSSTNGIKASVVNGVTSEREASEYMQKYDGKSKADADRYAAQYAFARDVGYDWSDVAEAYKVGAVSESALINWEIKCNDSVHGSKAKAEKYVEVVKWQANVDGFNMTIYDKYLAAQKYIDKANLSYAQIEKVIEIYNDAVSEYDDNGDSIDYSKAKAVAQKLYKVYGDVLTSDQLTALMEFVYGYKTIKKVKVW